MHRIVTFAALILPLIVNPPAHAATLLSSPVLVGGAGDQLGCYVTNVGKKDVTVAVTLRDELGNALSLSAETCASLLSGVLAPGQTCFVYRDPAPGYGRCSVEASASKIQAVPSVLNAGHVTASVAVTKK